MAIVLIKSYSAGFFAQTSSQIYLAGVSDPMGDKHISLLRCTFTLAVLELQGWVKKPELNAFYQAGYTKQHVLEVVLAISFKTLSNFINHINDTPIDSEFLTGLPDNSKTSCCDKIKP